MLWGRNGRDHRHRWYCYDEQRGHRKSSPNEIRKHVPIKLVAQDPFTGVFFYVYNRRVQHKRTLCVRLNSKWTQQSTTAHRGTTQTQGLTAWVTDLRSTCITITLQQFMTMAIFNYPQQDGRLSPLSQDWMHCLKTSLGTVSEYFRETGPGTSVTVVKLTYSLTDTSSKDDIIIRGGNTPLFFNLTPLILWHVTLRLIAMKSTWRCFCFFLLRKRGSMLIHVII